MGDCVVSVDGVLNVEHVPFLEYTGSGNYFAVVTVPTVKN